MSNEREQGRGRLAAAPERQLVRLEAQAEQLVRQALTPTRARLLVYAATKESGLLTANPYSPLPALSEQISAARPADLPFAAGERVSIERRRAFWQEGDRATLSFAEQNRQWNAGVTAEIARLLTPPRPDQDQTDEAKRTRQTLSALGLTGSAETVEKTFTSRETGEQAVTLNREIEAFRQRYLEGASDIRGFVKKIAQLSADQNGNINLAELNNRLLALKPLLAVFGDKSIDEMVHDYGVCYGLLSEQAPQRRAVLTRETQVRLQEEIVEPEKQQLMAVIHARQAALDREAGLREQPDRPPPTQVFGQPVSGQASQPSGADDPAADREAATASQHHPDTVQAEEPQAVGNGATGPELPEVQPDTRPEAEANRQAEAEQFAARVEPQLSAALGQTISLTPEQKAALPIIPTGEWRGGWYGFRGTVTPITENEYIKAYVDQYRRLQRKGLSHDEIVQELNKLLHHGNIIINENGKSIAVGFQETRDGAAWLIFRNYPRQP